MLYPFWQLILNYRHYSVYTIALMLICTQVKASYEPLGHLNNFPNVEYPNASKGKPNNARYNLRFGNTLLDLTSTFSVEYNDNISASGIDPKSDIILKPGLILNTKWQASDMNAFTTSIGISYNKYLQNTNLDSVNNLLNLDRNSNLKYKIKIKTFTLTFSDYFSFSADPTDSVSVDTKTNTVNKNVSMYSRFKNTAGVTIDHRQKKMAYSLNLGRTDLIPFQSQFKFTRRTEYVQSLTANYIANPSFIPGIRAGLSQNRYAQKFQNDSNGYFAGPIFQWRFTPLINIIGSASLGNTHFKNTGTNQDQSGSRSKNFNFTLEINHQLNKAYLHGFSISQTTQFGLISNSITLRSYEYHFSWKATRKITYHGLLGMEKGEDSGGLNKEKYTRFKSSVKFSYTLGKYLSSSLEGYYSRKSSRISNRSYNNKRLTASLAYDI